MSARARRIVLAAVGSEGDIRPLLAIGRLLRQRGHEVALAGHPVHRELVGGAGLRFIDASGVALPDDPGEFARRAFRRLSGPRFVIHDFAAADVAASHARLAAACGDVDLLVTTTLAFGAQVLAEQRGLRRVSVVLAPSSFVSAHEPPVTGWSWLDRFVASSPQRGRLLRGVLARAGHGWTAPVRAFRRAQGMPPEPPGGDPSQRGQHAPDCSLALFPAWFGAPQPDWPPQMRQSGFCFYRAPGVALAPRLVEFLDAGAPPLVFSLGSAAVHASERFLHESLEVVRRLGARAVLMTGSEAMRRRLPATLPPGVLTVESAPHALLFPRAAAVVHHGGVGTSAEALYAGRPMLVVPLGFDQFDNASRLQRLGVAEVLPLGRYRARRACEHLRRLLEQGHYRRRAMVWARRLHEEDGTVVAADAIEAQLGA